jgi:hypothetical protein
MAERQPVQTPEQMRTGLKRRGLLAGAWAAVAAIVAKQTTEPVAATTDTDFVATGTGVINFDARGTGTTGIETGNGTFDTGVDAFGTAYGLYAGGGSYGVSGIGNAAGTLGTVLGVSAAGTSGVWGTNFAAGAGSIGVRGSIPGVSVAASTIAVYGENLSTNTGGAPGAGGYGVYGFSAHGHGVIGGTVGPGGGGVVGSGFGVPGVWAGLFFGSLAVVGGAKSAAVANDDGTHSLLYCLESPESWFEDFGEATLDCGRAEVRIDPAFAAVVDLSAYHIFVTSHGDFQLHVTARERDHFTVQQTTGSGATESDGTFSWRLVAKRKDITAPRLAKIQLPPEPRYEERAIPTTPEIPHAHRDGQRESPILHRRR